MPATLWTCADCSTQYALDLDACPHCGSSNRVEEGGAVTKRLPLFVTVQCTGCGRGPWTVRLQSMHSGLLLLPTLACASCGSRVPVTWPPEEEPMSPKITVHGGATNTRADADVSPAAVASQPLAGAEADQGRPTSDEPGQDPETGTEAEAAPGELDDDGSVDPYAGMTLVELREEADKRTVPSYGTKAQIAERLREADAAVSGGDVE